MRTTAKRCAESRFTTSQSADLRFSPASSDETDRRRGLRLEGSVRQKAYEAKGATNSPEALTVCSLPSTFSSTRRPNAASVLALLDRLPAHGRLEMQKVPVRDGRCATRSCRSANRASSMFLSVVMYCFRHQTFAAPCLCRDETLTPASASGQFTCPQGL